MDTVVDSVTMEDLLNALRLGNVHLINHAANALLITKNEEWNKAQISEFEKYAPCQIFPLLRQHYKYKCKAGGIRYNGTIYIFG